MSLPNHSRLAFQIDELTKANIRLQRWVTEFEEKAEIYQHALLEIRENDQCDVKAMATHALKAGQLCRATIAREVYEPRCDVAPNV